MELRHARLKALVMNNCREGKEHGGTQNKEEVRAAPLSRKQVGAAELYIRRRNSGECTADFLWAVLAFAVQDDKAVGEVVGDVSSQIFHLDQLTSYAAHITDGVENWLHEPFYANSLHVIHIKFVFLRT